MEDMNEFVQINSQGAENFKQCVRNFVELLLWNKTNIIRLKFGRPSYKIFARFYLCAFLFDMKRV